MTGEEIAAGVDPGSAAPVSFLRWAGPVMVVWVPVCIGYLLIARDSSEGTNHTAWIAPFFLFPVYAFLYIGWLNIYLSTRSVGVKTITSVCLAIICMPVLYILPTTLVWLALMGGGVVNLFGAIGPFVVPISVYLVGWTCGVVLSFCEYWAVGSTDRRTSIQGILGFGVLALALQIVTAISDQLLFPAIVLAGALPVPHLVLAWRRRFRFGQAKAGCLSPGKILAATAVLFASLYVLGVQRHVLDFGVLAFQWPKIVLQTNAQYAFDEVRGEILESPNGRGSLPIGGWSFLIPAALTDSASQRWNATTNAYAALGVAVPYEDWIEGNAFDVSQIRGRWGPIRDARLSLSTFLPDEIEDSAEVLCAPEAVFGLRSCLANDAGGRWLRDQGIDPESLTADRLLPPYRRSIGPPRLTLLLYPWTGLSGGAPGAEGVVIQCELLAHPDIDESVRILPPPQVIASGCAIAFVDGTIRVRARIDPAMVPYWRPIEAGMRRDIATWEAAAVGAESIEAVARRQAELLVGDGAGWPWWRDLHCILVAAVGSDWAMPMEPPFRSLGECPPIVRPQSETGAR